MEYTTFDELQDKYLGKVGTNRRDNFEAKLQEELQAYQIGEVIKKARKEKNLTQEQLGELMGVKRAQISRIENGHNLTISTVARAFKAMNIPANIAFGGISLSLW
ncbi:MAG: helix-turn-helix transcriptional regulator [Muribaculaceae bacterium]|nr:helix-turn-helix transcriptional regulator [Muribaculaceae bacterium]